MTPGYSLMVNVVCLCIVCLGLVQPCGAQTAQEYFTRTDGIGARAEGLGGAYVSDPYDVSVMYWNPGGLLYLQHPSITINHSTDLSSRLMTENVAFPLRSSRMDVIAVGATVNHRGYVGHDFSEDFRLIQYGYDLAYAREVVPTLSFGGRIGVQYGTSGSSNLWAASTSFGLFYSPTQEVSYGASVSGLGSDIVYTFDGSGVAISPTNAPRSLQVGAMMRFPAPVKESVLLVAIANEKIFGEDGLLYRGGVELFPVKNISLRVGYLYKPGSIAAARYGIGLEAGRIHFDYGVSPSQELARTYNLAVSFDLRNSGREVAR
jgi:hypothetical protein